MYHNITKLENANSSKITTKLIPSHVSHDLKSHDIVIVAHEFPYAIGRDNQYKKTPPMDHSPYLPSAYVEMLLQTYLVA